MLVWAWAERLEQVYRLVDSMKEQVWEQVWEQV